MTTTARPRAIIVSEIIQLVLLAEPLRRALQTGFIVSVVGTVAITCVAGGVILSATRRKKIWARDVLAGLAVLSWLLATGLTVWERKLGIAAGVLTINLVAVAMLFSANAENRFGQNATETVR